MKTKNLPKNALKNTQNTALSRFYTPSLIPREEVGAYPQFSEDLENFKAECTVLESFVERGSLVLWVNKNEILHALSLLKALKYEVLCEHSAIDFLEQKGGFEIFYELLSFEKRARVRLKAFLKPKQNLQSAAKLFGNANWAERECYDMFGIIYENHPNLKRILMPDDWVGNPLLKSYPLEGDENAQWYEIDSIFGRENREKIGAENRDSAKIERYNSEEFARVGFETPRGAEISEQFEPEPNPITYQEAQKPAFVRKMTKQNQVQLKERG